VLAGFGHAALGWVCPGASQIRQGLPVLGWTALGLVLGMDFLAGALLRGGVMGLAEVQIISTGITIAKLALIVDAILRMARGHRYAA
jgi:hypothetical protein